MTSNAFLIGQKVYAGEVVGRLLCISGDYATVEEIDSRRRVVVGLAEVRRQPRRVDRTIYPERVLKLAAANGVSPRLVARWLEEVKS